jgi:hypothetical protein
MISQASARAGPGSLSHWHGEPAGGPVPAGRPRRVHLSYDYDKGGKPDSEARLGLPQSVVNSLQQKEDLIPLRPAAGPLARVAGPRPITCRHAGKPGPEYLNIMMMQAQARPLSGQ